MSLQSSKEGTNERGSTPPLPKQLDTTTNVDNNNEQTEDSDRDSCSSQENANEARKASSGSDFKSTSETLVRKLLELSSPRLDVKIVGVLLLEGVMETFMSHITRLDPTNEKIALSSLTMEEKILLAGHERDKEDLDATKRSYHAMELLCGTSANHFWIQDSRFQVIVSYLLDVLLPTSNGNLYHFVKVFRHLMRRQAVEMLDYIVMQDNATRFFDYMLPYITHGPVLDAVLDLLFVRDIDIETRDKRMESHERLHELGFIEWLLKAIQCKNSSFEDAAQELFLRVVEESSQVDDGEILLNSLHSEKGGPFVIGVLVKLVTESMPSRRRELSIHLLKSLLKSGTNFARSSQLPLPAHGPLYQTSVRCQELISEHISVLCSVIVKDRSTASTQTRPITALDMELLEIIYPVLAAVHNTADILDSIPQAFWRILVDSFFEKSSSNIYHTLFYRLFCLMLHLHHEPTLNILIRKQKLLTRMIDIFEKDKSSDMRGFILLILNHLRLLADTNHDSLVHRIISSHPRYQAFAPVLRKETLLQTEYNYPWKVDGCPRPPTHLGPCPPLRSTHFSPYSATLQLMEGDNEEPSQGIELGSDYAYCMGFDHAARQGDGVETPLDHLSRRNSCDSSLSEESRSSPFDIAFESLTSEPPRSKKKKKKEKQKEKGNNDESIVEKPAASVNLVMTNIQN